MARMDYKPDAPVPEHLKEAARLSQLKRTVNAWQDSQGGSRKEYYARLREEERQQERKRQDALTAFNNAMNPGLSQQEISRGIELNFARQAEQTAKQQYEGYKASDQRKTDWDKAIRDAIMEMPAAGSSLDLELGKLPEKTINQTEAQHEAAANYFEQSRKATEDRHMMEDDVAEVEAMSAEDRRLLETYAYGRNEWFDHKAIGDSVSARVELEKKYGKQKVEELAESWQRYQNMLSAEKNRQQTMEGAGSGFFAGVGHSAASVAANAIGSLTAPFGYLQEAFGRTGRYQTLDPNNVGAMPGQYASAVREAVSEDMGAAGKVLYHGTMGALDNLARIAMGGGTKFGSLGLAALGSFGSTLSEASAQGATPGQAVGKAILSSGLEVATEYVPLDELFKAGKSGYKGAAAAFRQALKQGGIEAAEEEIALLGNLLVDALVLREKSGYAQQVGELVANGMSYQEAKAQADRALWDEAVNTALTSFVSGGVMSGAQSGAQYVGQRMQDNARYKAQLNRDIQAMMQREAADAYRNKATVSQTEAVGEENATTEKPTAEEYIDAMAEDLAGKPETQERFKTEELQVSARDAATESGLRQLVKDIDGGMSRQELMNKSREYSQQYNAIQAEVPYGKPYTEEQLDRMHTAYILYSAYFGAARDPDGTANMYRAFLEDMEAGVDAENVRYDRSGRTVLTTTTQQEGRNGVTRLDLLGEQRDRILDRAMELDKKRGRTQVETLEMEQLYRESDNLYRQIEEEIKQADMAADSDRYAPQGALEGFEAMGAASRGFSPYTQMQNEYGNIPEGENPVRPDDAPISTDGTDRVSYTARTAIGAEVTPDEFVPLIENEVVRGGFSFIPITNDQTVQNAVQSIQSEGWRTARANWTAQVRQGRTGADITAIGALLYNHAVNSGEYREAMDILVDYQQAVRNAAQAVQAARILKRLTPENRLYVIRRSIQRMVEDMHLNREITIDEDLARRYQETRDDAEADRILDEIARDVARQIPPTLGERITALRYLNMLGNFRTQVRNWFGNVGAKVTYLAKDEVAATIEAMASAVSGGRFQRSKVHIVDGTTRRAARADYQNVADWISNGGRANDRGTESDDFARRVQENRRILPAPLEQYRRATNWAMNNAYFGDAAFGREAYARALAGYLNARGIRADNLNAVDRDTLNQAREYAVRQAQEATFRDNNEVSTFVSRALRGRNTPAWAQVIGEAIMPFRKTPANVLVRAEEFSPLGLINSAVNTVRAARGDISGAELVESWAKTLTGTGLFAIGWALANMGYLRGGPDEDEEKAAFDELNGYQDYALVLPDGTNLTIDFFSPAAIPMLLGAQFDKILNGTDLTWADLEGVFSTLADPMIEMSMLQGVNDTIDAIRYADNSLMQFAVNAMTNYVTQALGNTLLGQLERSTEESRMTTYIDKDSNVPAWLQRNLGKLSQKIPGIDFQQTSYIDQWGEEQKNPPGIANWLYQLLSPSYIDKANVDAVANELYRLNEAQTGTNVFPQSPEDQISYTDSDGNRIDKYNLSMEELDRLKRTEGQTQARLVADLIGGQDYNALTDAQKAKAVSLCYDYARELARGEVLPGYDGMDSWMQGIEGSEAAAIIQKVTAAEMTDAFTAITQAWREGYESDSRALEALENAAAVYDDLTPEMQKIIRENSSGRVGAFIEARAAGMDAQTFGRMYRTYWDIDQREGMTATRRANAWAAELREAMEEHRITKQQHDLLRESLVFRSSQEAKATRFDGFVEQGIDTDDAAQLAELLYSITGTGSYDPETGRNTVRDVDRMQAVAGASYLTPDERFDAMRAFMNDGQIEKMETVRDEFHVSASQYAAIYRAYLPQDTKAEEIAAYMKLGYTKQEAERLYRIYHPTK